MDREDENAFRKQMGQVAQYSKDLTRLSDIAQLIRVGGIPTFMVATEGGSSS